MIKLTKAGVGIYTYKQYTFTKQDKLWNVKLNDNTIALLGTLSEARSWVSEQEQKPIDNVISFLDARFKPKMRPKRTTQSELIQEIDRNLKNKRRLEEERKNNNKKILRQYRIIK